VSARNQPVAAWLQCHSGENQLSRADILRSLASAGIDASADGNSLPLRVIIFERQDPELLNLVAACSEAGHRRVLVIALHKTALTGGFPWRLLQAGASDVCAWDSMEQPAECIAARLRRWQEIDDLIDSPLVRENLVGASKAWLTVLRQVIEVARFTDTSVLITGESGTGKELIARLIHTLDARPRKRDLVVLDCTTIVPELAGSEFFGHERGAFTHALTARDGAFALADGGSLFLDEVGELPLTLQADLLRVVQERTYKRVGSNAWKNVNFRMVCATNRNLDEEKARGSFRLDFYHRIASWTCRLPSLNERREDIIPLTHHFLREMCSSGDPPELDTPVRDYLLLRDYPGNVRELRQLVGRIGKRHVGNGPITIGDIPEDESPFAAKMMTSDWKDANFQGAIRRALSLGVTLKQISSGATEVAVRIAVDDEMGNLQQAARKLGVTDRALQMRRAARRDVDDDNTSPNSTEPSLPSRDHEPLPSPPGQSAP
jgi:transcriptional regulator with GAF, ATPase, and Fis domain